MGRLLDRNHSDSALPMWALPAPASAIDPAWSLLKPSNIGISDVLLVIANRS